MKKLIISLFIIVLVLTTFFTGCGGDSSTADTTAVTTTTSQSDDYEPITLSFSTPGSSVIFQNTLTQRMFDEIKEASGGKITITTYYGGSLLSVGATYDGVVDGAADIGYDQPSYNKGRYPVIELIEQPWGYTDTINANHITLDVFEKYQPEELKDVVVLGVYSFGHPVMITNTPVQSLEDLAGLKIRGTGNMASMISALGAAAVSMPITEVYDALNKGTVDGCLVGPECIPNWNLDEVGKYATDVSCIAPNMIGLLFMNRDKFESLPKAAQDTIMEVSGKYKAIVDEELEAFTLSSYDYGRDHGMEILYLDPEEQDRWQQAMQTLTSQFVADKKANTSLPVDEIVSFIKQSIADYKQ